MIFDIEVRVKLGLPKGLLSEALQKEGIVILNGVKNLKSMSKSEILRSLRSLRMTHCGLF